MILIRKTKGRGERISLPVDSSTKKKWEEIQRVLKERGYEIEFDGMVLKIIRSIETAIKNEPGSAA